MYEMSLLITGIPKSIRDEKILEKYRRISGEE